MCQSPQAARYRRCCVCVSLSGSLRKCSRRAGYVALMHLLWHPFWDPWRNSRWRSNGRSIGGPRRSWWRRKIFYCVLKVRLCPTAVAKGAVSAESVALSTGCAGRAACFPAASLDNLSRWRRWCHHSGCWLIHSTL